MCDFDIERIPVKSTSRTTDDSIKELSAKLTDAENEIARLREERDKLQGEKNDLVTKQYHLDYQVANQQERIKDIGKTLELYERENRAMKELLRMYL